MDTIVLECQNRFRKIIEMVSFRSIDIKTENPNDLIGKRFVFYKHGSGLEAKAPVPFLNETCQYHIIDEVISVIPSGYCHNYLKGKHVGMIAWDLCLIETE